MNRTKPLLKKRKQTGRSRDARTDANASRGVTRATERNLELLRDRAYEILAREIATGRFRPGERIREKELEKRLRISRTPVREALLRLEAEGVVVCNSRHSYNVEVLTVEDVRELYQTLAILEGAAAEGAASMGRKDVQLLERYNRAMAGAARRGDLLAFGRWNRRFHDVFLAKVENRTLRRACHSIRARLYTFPVRRASLARWLKKSVEEHREIIRLARAGDAKRLGRYFRNVHWSYAKNQRYIEDAFDRHGEAGTYL